jgi:hypothetical protein
VAEPTPTCRAHGEIFHELEGVTSEALRLLGGHQLYMYVDVRMKDLQHPRPGVSGM